MTLNRNLRITPVKTDAELLAEMGTDPEAWAMQLGRVMPFTNVPLAAAWFHHAIEAGRKEAPAPVSYRPVDEARNRALRVLAASARASIECLREIIDLDNNAADVQALNHVDGLLGSTVTDPGFRGEANK